MTRHPVFFDPTKRRSVVLGHLGRIVSVISTIMLLAFVASVLFFPGVSVLPLAPPHKRSPLTVANDIAQRRELLPAARRLADDARSNKAGLPKWAKHQVIPKPSSKQLAGIRAREGSRPLTIGFYVTWDDSSYASLAKAMPKLDWVVPSWLELVGPDMELKTGVDQKSVDLLRRQKVPPAVLPMLQNASDGKWDGPGLARMLADPAKRQARLNNLVAFLETNAAQGLVVDFEEVPKEAHKNLITFLREMRQAFAPHGWLVAICAPFDDPDWTYRVYATVTDYQILMAYDEHFEEGSAGAIASQPWFVDKLSQRMKELNPAHTIVALGNYGYDWGGKGPAIDMTFQETVLSSKESEAPILFDPATLNPYFQYKEDDGSTHDVWFLDAVTAHNQIRAADVFRPMGYALWRLGSEDPSIWSLLGRPYDAGVPEELKTIVPGSDIDIEGEGEILSIAAEPASGARTFEMGKNQIITSEAFTTIPTSYVIRRSGFVPNKVALTFDDGPSAEWTPQILDILKEKGAKATFFIVGENGEANPSLVQRLLADGHEIGNHTFTHPNLGETSEQVSRIEINATQRLVEALTGRSMRLFRAPFFGDAEPTTPSEINPVKLAQTLGYVSVGLRVDPDDWQKPPADLIVKRVLDRMADTNPETRGQIVLLHDAGGDRSQTVKALPRIIDALRAKGLKIVPVSELAGWTFDQVMPPVPPEDRSTLVNWYVFITASWLQSTMHFLFKLAIGLGLARLAALCGLALWSHFKRGRTPPVSASDGIAVTVLIPAFNEENVIGESVVRILESRHVTLEVIVIDDGSTDGTSDVVRRSFGADPRVTLITIANGGKAHAVNTGLERAAGEVIIALDADTQFEPDTIAKLTRWFGDATIGAVAGNAKVGNRINMLTRWQALEYISAQNLERRALAALDCITVVPGAVGAWRRSALAELGGFPGDTLAEDQDLTIAIQKAGYRAIFDADAVAWTEAPDTVAGLAKQRFRWSFGTLQCLWKHADVTFRPRYGALGLVALPQAWLFQILLGLISPFVDLMLVVQVVTATLDYLEHGAQFDPTNLEITLFYYALFMTVDLATAAIAFLFEKKEDWRLLWWLVLQRFDYRQLLYYVVVKSVISAAKGHLVGWGKLDRKATVNQAALPPKAPPSEDTRSS
ncbi:polysaccharide deacetylase family protein [uncultured Hyphomicrobium sp.]|uniref:polysaccharide deacetylase family protein n=1 Tax=uncultured Hyphomicrobium sp. TaxID=194373 RepID=UPI0025E80082|nr:polysaccharide deacetylase family protein [uncultured Hyphomicrobium sp.]